MKKCWVLLALLLCVTAVNAQETTVFDTNFDGSVPSESGPELTNVTWAQDDSMAGVVNVSTTIASVNDFELSQTPPAGGPDQWEDNVAVNHNLNTDRPTPRGLEISFSVASGAANVALSEVAVSHTHTTNAGRFQAYASDMTVTLQNVTDGVELFTDTTSYDYSTWGWQDHAYDLSTITLEAGKDYMLVITMQDMVGGGAYATWNQVTLKGINPNAPTFVGPEGDMVAIDTDLEWGAPSAYVPTGYNLYLRKGDPNFGDPANSVLSVTDGSATSPFAVSLENDTTYYWQVEALDGATVHAGDVWEFTTIPAVPVIETQPVGQLVDAGADAVFTIEGLNFGTVTWMYVDNDGVETEAGNGSTLTVTGAQAAEGRYYAVVVNAAAPEGVQSDYARLMTRRLVAEWDFEGTADASYGGFAGTIFDPNTANAITPAISYVADGVNGGQAIEFAAGDEIGYVEVTNSAQAFNFYPLSYTINSWIKTTQEGYGGYVAKQYRVDGQWGFVLNHNGGTAITTLRQVTGDVSSNEVPVNDGEWHMVTGVYDAAGETMSLYVDGVLRNQVEATGAAGENDVPLIFGAAVSDPEAATPFEGLLDSVSIWSYPVSANDVAQIYADITGESVCTGPVEHDFNEDCKVDLADFAIFADSWLESHIVNPQ